MTPIVPAIALAMAILPVLVHPRTFIINISKKMKANIKNPLAPLYFSLALLYALFAGLWLVSCNNARASSAIPDEYYDSPEYAEQLRYDVDAECYGEPVDGMCFNTAYVVDCRQYDDHYAIVYDNPDAGMRNAEIVVGVATYAVMLHAYAVGDEIVGTLNHIGDGVWSFTAGIK